MEQKTFLAIVISFLFLISYNAIVVAPKQKEKASNIAQTIDSKTVEDIPVANSIQKAAVEELLPEEEQTVNIGAFTIAFTKQKGTIKRITSNKFKYTPILTNFLTIANSAHLRSFSSTKNDLTLHYEDNGVFIDKNIKAVDEYRLAIQISYLSSSNLSKVENVQLSAFDIFAHTAKDDPEAMRDAMLFEYSQLVDGKVLRKNNAYKFSNKETKNELKSTDWFGWRDRYYFAALVPNFKIQQYSIKHINDHELNFNFTLNQIIIPSKYDFTLYMGPQDLKILNSFDGNIHKIMAFSGNPILDFIEKLIYKFLLLLNVVTKNWGVSIILISLIIYGATYPLTFKSMMSMKKMQELQPKMTELREKHKNDPQKLNTEVVQLYRVHNVNPLGGCLPMLFQMPIFISLYQVLWRTHNFEGANFLWIKDLARPDRAFILNSKLPFIGNEINILPVLMMVVMFMQQKLSSKSVTITDPSQEMQQKMMMYIFPIFIGGIFYHFASGLTLYFTIFYLLSALTQYKMSKMNSKTNERKI